MNPKKTPDMGCVTVSTTEKPVYNRDLGVTPDVGMSLSEQSCLKYLVKECGWYWIDAGVLRKARFTGGQK